MKENQKRKRKWRWYDGNGTKC